MRSPSVKDNNITDWESYVEFRVILPDERQVTTEQKTEVSGAKSVVTVLVFGGMGLVVVVVVAASLLMMKRS